MTLIRRSTTIFNHYRDQFKLAKILSILAFLWAALLPWTQLHAQVTTEEARHWQADLDYLNKQLVDRHVDLYHSVSEDIFSEAVAQLDADIPSLDQAEILVRFAQLLALIGDGHTSFFAANQEDKAFQHYPLRFWAFSEGIFVIATHAELSHLLGKRLVKIDATEIADAHAAIRSTISADNDMEYTYSVPFMLSQAELLWTLGIAGSVEQASFLFADNTRVELDAISQETYNQSKWTTANPLYGSGQPPSMRVDFLFASPVSIDALSQMSYYWFTLLEAQNSLYFQYNISWDQDGRASFAAVTDQLMQYLDNSSVERVIIDIRQNSGGEPATAQPLIDALAARPYLAEEGRLFVLVGRRTYSAALTTAAHLRSEAGAKVVGEASRGKPNNPSEGRDILLEQSGTYATVSTQFLNRDPALGGRPFLPVDIPVESSFSDYKQGRDVILEAALSAKLHSELD
jgi:hypothetical protein